MCINNSDNRKSRNTITFSQSDPGLAVKIKALSHISLQYSVFVANVMSHDGLPVGVTLLLTFLNGTFERFAGGQLAGKTVLEVNPR